MLLKNQMKSSHSCVIYQESNKNDIQEYFFIYSHIRMFFGLYKNRIILHSSIFYLSKMLWFYLQLENFKDLLELDFFYDYDFYQLLILPYYPSYRHVSFMISFISLWLIYDYILNSKMKKKFILYNQIFLRLNIVSGYSRKWVVVKILIPPNYIFCYNIYCIQSSCI